jgi:hypothetical protein
MLSEGCYLAEQQVTVGVTDENIVSGLFLNKSTTF